MDARDKNESTRHVIMLVMATIPTLKTTFLLRLLLVFMMVLTIAMHKVTTVGKTIKFKMHMVFFTWVEKTAERTGIEILRKVKIFFFIGTQGTLTYYSYIKEAFHLFQVLLPCSLG